MQFLCLDEIVTQLPGGVATQVGERGERLSGGQRQTVAIARALLTSPPLLLLDEPSSMVDPATEQKLIARLRALTDTTIVLVTHRMAMLALIDRLVVMDRGRVVADGPRDEVLKALAQRPGDDNTARVKAGAGQATGQPADAQAVVSAAADTVFRSGPDTRRAAQGAADERDNRNPALAGTPSRPGSGPAAHGRRHGVRDAGFVAAAVAWAIVADLDVAVQGSGVVAAPEPPAGSAEPGRRHRRADAGGRRVSGQARASCWRAWTPHRPTPTWARAGRTSSRRWPAARASTPCCPAGAGVRRRTWQPEAPELIDKETQLWRDSLREFESAAPGRARSHCAPARRTGRGTRRAFRRCRQRSVGEQSFAIEERLFKEGAGARADFLAAQQRLMALKADLDAVQQSRAAAVGRPGRGAGSGQRSPSRGRARNGASNAASSKPRPPRCRRPWAASATGRRAATSFRRWTAPSIACWCPPSAASPRRASRSSRSFRKKPVADERAHQASPTSASCASGIRRMSGLPPTTRPPTASSTRWWNVSAPTPSWTTRARPISSCS